MAAAWLRRRGELEARAAAVLEYRAGTVEPKPKPTSTRKPKPKPKPKPNPIPRRCSSTAQAPHTMHACTMHHAPCMHRAYMPSLHPSSTVQAPS